MTNYGTAQRKVKANVFEILEAFEETRNSDKALLLKYWEIWDEIDLGQTFARDFLTKGTSVESITRARRTIQSTGLFLPTDVEVLRKRRILAEEARAHHAVNN